jgi:uncharacterized protein (DUF1697 family)
VVLRTQAELERVVEGNPYPKITDKTLHVFFLADTPSKQAVATLDPQRSPPDTFVLRGKELYVHTPNGIGRSKLTSQYFDSRLQTVATARNWNTVLKLLALMG